MFYCEKCMLLLNQTACPKCNSEKIREANENDLVYLLTKDALWSGGIEDILKNNEIPYFKKGLQGAGLTRKLGYYTETYDFYVPYGAYEKSKQLLSGIMQ